MDIEYPENSDSSDEDYVPTGYGTEWDEVLSEVESDGDPEDPLSDSEDVKKKGPKRKKRKNKAKKKIKIETPDDPVVESTPVKPVETEEERKKRADSLWDMFKKETGFKERHAAKSSSAEPEKNVKEKKSQTRTLNKEPEKVKITQIFEFAGEEVKIEKEVPKDSAEARLTAQSSSSATAAGGRGKGKGSGGINSVLHRLGRKQKLSTLEKSKLDWNKFKKSEKIEEELDKYKKGKDGYLERQDFLERADLRRFEIEKELRTIERNKRMNNVPQ